MALACRPALLIADEPTTALDVTVQAEMLGLIDDLVVQQGAALLFITHDLAVVSQVCREGAVLNHGRGGRARSA
jgi:peptide/nickel transport system ATP-binding protein